MLTNSQQQEITQHIEQISNKKTHLIGLKPVTGGDINTCYLLQSGVGEFFLKTNTSRIASTLFAAEFEGLCDLRRQNALRVPQPFLFGEWREGGSFLLLEALSFGGRTNWQQLAEGLVLLHKIQSTSFGWQRSNFIGSSPQHNSRYVHWAEFWWNERLLPQLQMAYSAGHSALKAFEKHLA